eukprot:gene24927-29919_t
MIADATVSESKTAVRRGRLVVLAGPSAVGKSSVVRELRTRLPELVFSVSATTRDPRPGEVDGKDYRFTSREEFQRMIDSGELLEWAEIHGGLQRSGTPAAPVEEALEAGKPVLVEVDLAGARAVRKAMPEALLVFMAPPSWDVLVQRLTGRGTETEDVVARRLETARVELAAQDEFDTVIVNEDVSRACDESNSGDTRVSSTSAASAAGQGALPAYDTPLGITNPPIDELLERTSSKYALVIYSAKRARQINDYYNQLGDGILEYVGPLVEPGLQEKPLSIARVSTTSAAPEPRSGVGGVSDAPTSIRKRIVVGVGGGIAAYKACSIIRSFTESGHHVRVIPTESALEFVGRATFEALSGNPVHTGVFNDVPQVPHVRLGQEADLVVIAPATADLMARAVMGRADDLLTATLLTAR